jgi:hypothetical protein
MADVLHQELEKFLSRLLEVIDQQPIQERDLEEIVGVRTPKQLAVGSIVGDGSSSKPTLLELLGYGVADVADHPKLTIIGRVTYEPDYLLQPQGRPLAVLDLKAPEVSLDKDKAASQICTYCHRVKAPLGLLFNGRELRVFINTEYKGLTRYSEFAEQPVAVVDRHDLSAMAALLARFSKSALAPNPAKLASTLATKRRGEESDRQRQMLIRQKLKEILADPPQELLAALPSLETVWDDFDPKPSQSELLGAWRLDQTTHNRPVATPGRTGANPELRRVVAQVCAARGWEAITQAHISGLRYRLDGVEAQGYRLVPQGPGVPPGLCVQGKDTAGARRIVADLENLLRGG